MGTVALADADVELVSASAYDGEAGQPDMYRCIVYDPALTERDYIEAVEFAPDQTTVVHHAIGFTLPESSRDAADELDDRNDGTGWPCFGSSGLPSEKRFLAWAPGQVFTDYGEGAGFAMDAGDFFVIQIHYHFEEDAPADYSKLRVRWADDTTDIAPITVNQFLAPAEIPCTADESGPLCDRPAAMAKALQAYGPGGALADIILSLCGQRPADFAAMTDGIATSSCDGRVETPGQIVSVLGHEHELGASFRMTLNPDTPDERVLLDIPKWDFEWQFNYEPVEEIIVDSSDVVRIECSWDRSLRDPELEPAYVLWADGTNDEMCFATIITRAVT
jgi:hypothetical protein